MWQKHGLFVERYFSSDDTDNISNEPDFQKRMKIWKQKSEKR